MHRIITPPPQIDPPAERRIAPQLTPKTPGASSRKFHSFMQPAQPAPAQEEETKPEIQRPPSPVHR